MRLLALACILSGQVISLDAQDSTRVLEEVKIEAYWYNRSMLDVPVAAAVVSSRELERFNNASLLPAVNTVPGVRMEERSPGSYRFSLRGSLVRSPFGVRNVKVYWNSLPLTDGGGNTYINLIDLSAIGSVEIIKGPGGSLYGAGTGGVLLLKSKPLAAPGFELSAAGGSYGYQRYQGSLRFTEGSNRVAVSYAFQRSDGYRAQSRLQRHGVNADWTTMLGQQTFLSTTMFFTDVTYETPGGLTKNEFDANARAARPAAGPNPGAEEQNAAVRNRSVFGGTTLDHNWSTSLSSRLGVFVSYSDFENFSIRNLEHRFETNFGARLESQYTFGEIDMGGKVIFGGEVQRFVSPFHVYQNNSGVAGPRTFTDDLDASLLTAFIQSEFNLPYRFSVTLAGSINDLQYGLEREYPELDLRRRNFDIIVSPRIAVLKKFRDVLSVYGSVSKGFSPPSLAEVRPSTETFNSTLRAEDGINFELGFRGAKKNVLIDVTVYDFRLQNTIVIQRVADGAEFFVNAGSTTQQGIEVAASVKLYPSFTIWSSYSYNHYRFDDYVTDGEDYSGNRLTGVPPTILNLGADVNFPNGVYLNITAGYTDHLPLNDANTTYANEYILIGGRTGYRWKMNGNASLEIFAGVDNALNQKYSLGNDLNAFGGRYYNVAPGINFFAGLKLSNLFAQNQ